MADPETVLVKIKGHPHPVLINKADFDEKQHALHDDKKAVTDDDADEPVKAKKK